ncbi:MAG: hypothetical protein ACRELE_08100 [Gemmatimonadales bacterium]
MRNSNRLTLLAPAMLLLLACGGGAAASAAAATKADSTAKDSVRKAATAKPVVAVHHRTIDTAAAAGLRPLVRETYTYEGSHRDPFQPLIAPVDRGPDLADLRLVAILYDDRDPGGSIATFRDIGNDRRYTVAPGQRIGRISVVSVGRNDVKLRLDDYGTPRDQTYALRKPEDQTP